MMTVTTQSGVASLRRRWATAARSGLAALLIGMSMPASAGDATPHVYGQTIGNWGQAWWQWALHFPTVINPLLQEGSVDCSLGQSGKVWFLAGTFGGEAERSCTVKHGKALFFPLLNGIWWTPEDCPTELACRIGVSTMQIDIITGWTCTVDGVPCVFSSQVVRAQSDARPLYLPPGAIAETDFGYSAGLREISIADGYWVMLDPLPRGPHTIRFTASSAFGGGFSLDVTYHLIVGP